MKTFSNFMVVKIHMHTHTFVSQNQAVSARGKTNQETGPVNTVV